MLVGQCALPDEGTDDSIVLETRQGNYEFAIAWD